MDKEVKLTVIYILLLVSFVFSCIYIRACLSNLNTGEDKVHPPTFYDYEYKLTPEEDKRNRERR